MFSATGKITFDDICPSGRSIPQDQEERVRKQIGFAKFQHQEIKEICDRKKELNDGLIVLICALVGISLYFVDYDSRNSGDTILFVVLGCGFFLLCAFAWSVLYSQLLERRVENAREDIRKAKSPLSKKKEEFPRLVRKAIKDWMREFSPNIEQYSIDLNKSLVYSPSAIVRIDNSSHTAIVILPRDIREVTISSPGYKSRSTAKQTVEGQRGNALAGAILGDVIAGDDWGAAGAVIGASGPRESVQHVTENVEALWSVDIYTKVEQLSVFSQDFGTNATAAKKFYSVISNSVPS